MVTSTTEWDYGSLCGTRGLIVTPEMHVVIERLDCLEKENRRLERDTTILSWEIVIVFLSCAVAILFRIDFMVWILAAIALGWALLTLFLLLVSAAVSLLVPRPTGTATAVVAGDHSRLLKSWRQLGDWCGAAWRGLRHGAKR
jgi:hypothetical protein